jgi:hypothetical protein
MIKRLRAVRVGGEGHRHAASSDLEIGEVLRHGPEPGRGLCSNEGSMGASNDRPVGEGVRVRLARQESRAATWRPLAVVARTRSAKPAPFMKLSAHPSLRRADCLAAESSRLFDQSRIGACSPRLNPDNALESIAVAVAPGTGSAQ